jgi:hypothetical protein
MGSTLRGRGGGAGGVLLKEAAAGRERDRKGYEFPLFHLGPI